MRPDINSFTLRAIYGVCLYTVLTVVQPVWAASFDCSEQFFEPSNRTNDSLSPVTQFIGKKGLIIESTLFEKQSKFVVLAPVNSWGRGADAKSLFVLAMRVQSNQEGLTFFKQLVEQVNSQHGQNWTVSVVGENFFEIPRVLKARVHPPFYSRHLPMAQGHLEIEIEIAESNHQVKSAQMVGAVLQQIYKLRAVSTSLIHLASYDLTTYEGRLAWGQEAFHEWLMGLPADAKAVLQLISGPEYRDVLPFLRGEARTGPIAVPTLRLQEMIDELDKAIQIGRIPVPVLLYRASSDQFSLDAWKRLSENPNAVVEPLSDRAYLFTTLDESFALLWNQSKLRGKGVIIEVAAPAGLRAGYVDRGPHSVDYAEVILARGQKLKPVRAYVDTQGQRRLVVHAL